MLPRNLRLKTPASFQKAFRYGRAFLFGNVGCRLLIDSGSGKKIGFIAAKKMFRRAVDRNRARRILSEAAGSITSAFPEDAQIVLFFRSRPQELALDVTKKDIEGLVRAVSLATRK